MLNTFEKIITNFITPVDISKLKIKNTKLYRPLDENENKIGYNGVRQLGLNNDWCAFVTINHKRKRIYRGKSYEDAVAARKKWENENGIIDNKGNWISFNYKYNKGRCAIR